MKVVKVQFHKADKEYFFLPEFTEGSDHQLAVGDAVVVETILGQDMGLITGEADFSPIEDNETTDENKSGNIILQKSVTDIKSMLRLANREDLKNWARQKVAAVKYLKTYRQLSVKHNLDKMKLIDVCESFDGSRLTFYFTADARVDFRELVKDLVQAFHKKIRLQQIGVRDAAKISGGLGSCGLALCCQSWLKTLGNVTPDYIRDQELLHRGADRLTGPCGRLKCCLRFEEENYKYHLSHLPQIGDVIKTKAGKGEVVSVHALKHTLDLEIDGNIVEYPYLENKQCLEHPADCSGCDQCQK